MILKGPLEDEKDLPEAPPPPEYSEATFASGSRQRPHPTSRPSGPNKERKREALNALGALVNRETSPPATPSWMPSFIRKRSEGRAQASIDEEVKETVLFLIREVVKDVTQPDGIDILQRCLAACQARSIPFESLAQQRFIESHTPLYWAIISARLRSPSPSSPSSSNMNTTTANTSVLDFLLSFPLTPLTKTDTRLACMVHSDNELYQRMRRTPGFESASYVDEVINGTRRGTAAGERVEYVRVESVGEDAAGAFRISFRVRDWLRKMRVAQCVPLEYVARGRTWSLTFRIAGPSDSGVRLGQWFADLRLLDGSPPTYLNGHLLIPPAKGTHKPVVVPFQTPHDRLSPSGVVRKKLKGEHGGQLEYDDSPYISPDGSLVVMGEFTLEKPQSECVIC